MTTSSPTKKQHYVPQFYLKAFSDGRGYLQVLDIVNKRLGTPRPYQGVGYAHYFYAAKTGVPDDISQHVEQWFQQIESVVATEFPRIIRKIVTHEHVTDDDRYVLAVLMSMLWLRSPAMREQLNQMEESMTKQVMRFYPIERLDKLEKEPGEKLSEADRERIKKMIETGDYRLKFNNAQHLRFMTRTLGFGGPGFTNMFFGMQWKAYIARGNRRFITTDSPVVEWWPPRKFYWGAGFMMRNKYFALTPEILLELTYPRGRRMFKGKTLFEVDDNLVMKYNLLLVSHAHEFAYSGERKIVEDILAGHANPGPVEEAYYEYYERPWADERRERVKGVVIERQAQGRSDDSSFAK